jgi:DNA-binding LacI/PurR family transcriptional regulator
VPRLAVAERAQKAGRDRRATLRDIARVASVSEPTASRSLRDDPQISTRTRAVVKRVADQLGYLPNATARSLATRSSRTLGLLVPDLTDPVHGQIVSGFEREATKRGYVLLVSNFLYDAAAESRSLRALLSNQAEGVCVFGGVMTPQDVVAMGRGANLVFVGPEDLSAAGKRARESVIAADDESGIREAVRTAIASGYRRFAYLSGPSVASTVRRRNAAQHEVDGDQRLDRLRVYEFDEEPTQTICARLVRDQRDIVLCYDDQRALRLLSALREAGVDVPRELGVIGFDDIPFAAISNPPLTTISVPHQEMGRLACDMLLAQLRTEAPQPAVKVEVRLVLRGTTTVQQPASSTTDAR